MSETKTGDTLRDDAGWDDIPARSWDELLSKLHSSAIVPPREDEGRHRRSPFIFRGMADSGWPLATSLERLGTPPETVETPLLRGFGKYAPVGTFTPDSEWERLAVAQHNGLPTRCLDWTASPLIAAHFATAEREHFDADGVIWCVDATAHRNELLPQERFRELKSAIAWVYDVKMLDHYLPTLAHFDATDQVSGDVLLFLEPPSISARIQNQFGLLSVMNGPSKSHDAYFSNCIRVVPGLVRRVVIHYSAKPEIRDMLDQNNITERMLFPGLPGLCGWLRRYYGPA